MAQWRMERQIFQNTTHNWISVSKCYATTDFCYGSAVYFEPPKSQVIKLSNPGFSFSKTF